MMWVRKKCGANNVIIYLNDVLALYHLEIEEPLLLNCHFDWKNGCLRHFVINQMYCKQKHTRAHKHTQTYTQIHRSISKLTKFRKREREREMSENGLEMEGNVCWLACVLIWTRWVPICRRTMCFLTAPFALCRPMIFRTLFQSMRIHCVCMCVLW